jgi:plastocyanin
VLDRRLAAVSFCAVALAAPLGAQPANAALIPWVNVTVTSEQFTPGEIVLTEGDSLILVNLDPTGQEHNIVSSDPGTPFASGNIALGGHGEVFGVPGLPPSTYPFQCTIHDAMRGNINVKPVPPQTR